MKKKEHLPFFGVGPFIAGFQMAITVAGIVLSCSGYLDFAKIEPLNIPLKIVGVILIAFGLYLYYAANYKSRLFENVSKNNLVTTGIYRNVRNPIYSAFLLACTGAICIANNVVLFVVPVICWAFMSIALKLSEEKWLKALYGEEYVQYCKRVNRCIPWFTKK